MIGTVVGLDPHARKRWWRGRSRHCRSDGWNGSSYDYHPLRSTHFATCIFANSFQTFSALKESQVLLLEMIREGLLYLKRRELPETAKKDLVIYLPPKLRKKVIKEEQAAMGEGLGL